MMQAHYSLHHGSIIIMEQEIHTEASLVIPFKMSIHVEETVSVCIVMEEVSSMYYTSWYESNGFTSPENRFNIWNKHDVATNDQPQCPSNETSPWPSWLEEASSLYFSTSDKNNGFPSMENRLSIQKKHDLSTNDQPQCPSEETSPFQSGLEEATSLYFPTLNKNNGFTSQENRISIQNKHDVAINDQPQFPSEETSPCSSGLKEETSSLYFPTLGNNNGFTFPENRFNICNEHDVATSDQPQCPSEENSPWPSGLEKASPVYFPSLYDSDDFTSPENTFNIWKNLDVASNDQPQCQLDEISPLPSVLEEAPSVYFPSLYDSDDFTSPENTFNIWKNLDVASNDQPQCQLDEISPLPSVLEEAPSVYFPSFYDSDDFTFPENTLNIWKKHDVASNYQPRCQLDEISPWPSGLEEAPSLYFPSLYDSDDFTSPENTFNIWNKLDEATNDQPQSPSEESSPWPSALEEASSKSFPSLNDSTSPDNNFNIWNVWNNVSREPIPQYL
ncbi:Hypothetical predicted protein [Pelobates cultripes]|uniref:Uncharacterized protein n=1 Tax=Pelobates cultripes TaxID=61616 RepID=A0AAD1TCX2_PELCU|nr:Hypothetical predicted protein [Pelobates cultripes]